jgi:hypothetical protein
MDMAELEFEARKNMNGAYYNDARITLEMKRIEEISEKYHEACCQIWQVQGRKYCTAFYCAVLDRCLSPYFAGRKARLFAELNRRDRKHWRLPSSVAYQARFSGELERFEGEWRKRIQIAIRNNEYRERAEREAQAASAAIPQAPQADPDIGGDSEIPILSRREARKQGSQAKYRSWQQEYLKLKKRHPGLTDLRYSKILAGLPISDGKSAETIRKHIRKTNV